MMRMNIEQTVNNDVITLTVSGRLDTSTAPQLEKTLEDIISTTNELILDFTDLAYISSAGLRVLLKAQKAIKTKGVMKLIHVNSDVMEIFEITGFIDILTIEN